MDGSNLAQLWYRPYYIHGFPFQSLLRLLKIKKATKVPNCSYHRTSFVISSDYVTDNLWWGVIRFFDRNMKRFLGGAASVDVPVSVVNFLVSLAVNSFTLPRSLRVPLTLIPFPLTRRKSHWPPAPSGFSVGVVASLAAACRSSSPSDSRTAHPDYGHSLQSTTSAEAPVSC